jgi:hypothetical protein
MNVGLFRSVLEYQDGHLDKLRSARADFYGAIEKQDPDLARRIQTACARRADELLEILGSAEPHMDEFIGGIMEMFIAGVVYGVAYQKAATLQELFNSEAEGVQR